MEITPQHFNLFADFQRHAGLLSAAVDLLRDAATAAVPDAFAGLAAIQKLERDGDEIVRRAIQQLDRQLTDVVPREDARRCFAHLDNVLDATELLAGRLAAFRLGRLPGPAITLMNTIESCNGVLHEVIHAFGEGKHFPDLVARMAELENEADQNYLDALRELFESETDPVRLIKLNETYGLLEKIVNLFEDCVQEMEDAALKRY